VVGTLRTHKDGNGFREMQGGVAPTLPARAREDGSGQPVIFSGLRIRRLSPVECERLQAFPDDWTKYGAKGELISDTQRYKMCGNAVTTNVIQAVFERIFASA
jgi:DNA (cytosine-5)-methyltransferase 1